MTELTKIVIPVAGLGTRVLPASKVIPKEMLTVVDKPVIQYVVEEAVAAGFREIILVTRPIKKAIESHFEPQTELEETLLAKGKIEQLAMVSDILPRGVRISTAFQDEPLGLGHAVLCAAELIGDDDFAVSLPDVLIFNPDGDHAQDLKNIVAAFQQNHAAQIMVERVPDDQVSSYGIVDCGGARFETGVSHNVVAMVEKPSVDAAPSNQSIIGRYILPSRTLELLRQTRPGAGGEIQLTDAINALIGETPVQANGMYGRTYDCGSKLGYLLANINFGLRHPEIGTDLANWLRQQEF
ncbi:MAG: UTP--glucose-1-phosphate uridylyltransferase [Gammaproteobacteria bacterium]|nr:UTP--glucose-1-phosphate uridylyltransferase [Gammaproteobacteria bacterium]MDH3536303.1 UTP--glucose-1-phosphate uridylyltransferase [Gammaproteobacteria bacterium]